MNETKDLSSEKLTKEEILSLLEILDKAAIQGVASARMIVQIADKLANIQIDEQ
jgi:hypothetical protein